jgi:purine-binding chemotaxis protein CheW
MVPMDRSNHLVVIVLALDEWRLALPLAAVERVVRAVEVAPLPGAPDVVHGVVNMQGRVLPVINLRRRCGLPDREIDPGDQIVVAHTSRRSVALAVDSALVVECGREAFTAGEEILPRRTYVQGVVKCVDRLVLVCDPERLLNADEAQALDGVLAAGAA